MMLAGRGDYREVTREICYIVQGPISAEVVSLEAEGMVEEAKRIAQWSPHVVIKVPTIPEGLKAMNAISKLEVDPETLCQDCPWFGQCDTPIDKARDLASLEIFSTYGIETEVIAASIRHPMHITEAALAGADIATVPYKVLVQAVKHPLTDVGVQRFLDDWAKVSK